MVNKYPLNRGYQSLNTVEKANAFFSNIEIYDKLIKNIEVYMTKPYDWHMSQKMFAEGERIRFIDYGTCLRLVIQPYCQSILVIQFEDDSYLCVESGNVPRVKYGDKLEFEYHVIYRYPSNKYADVFDYLKGLRIDEIRIPSLWRHNNDYGGCNHIEGLYFKITNFNFNYLDADNMFLNNETEIYDDVVAVLFQNKIAYYTNREM